MSKYWSLEEMERLLLSERTQEGNLKSGKGFEGCDCSD